MRSCECLGAHPHEAHQCSQIYIGLWMHLQKNIYIYILTISIIKGITRVSILFHSFISFEFLLFFVLLLSS
ncbi:hypothetical protein V8C37DRAFT_384621 [Trichoderma ceciliae]